MSKLIGIAIRKAKRSPMLSLKFAMVTKNQGIDCDFRGKRGQRQVTVLNQKSWMAACDDLGNQIDWQVRRANLLVDDLNLYQSSGKTIKIGEVRLLITGETDPCSRMNESVEGLFGALLMEWRGGVCCKVVSEGKITLNDKVVLLD